MADKTETADRYTKAYAEWASNKDNPYSFSREDSAEHSYTAGQGYNKSAPGSEEQKSLSNCLSLLGAVMIINYFFDIITLTALTPFAGGRKALNVIMFSERFLPFSHIENFVAVIYCIITFLKYYIPIYLLKIRTKLPREVVSGHPHQRSLVSFNSIITMLVIMVVGRIAGMMLSNLLALVGLDSVYCLMMADGSVFVMLTSVVANCVLVPIMIEILFRGYVLQMFRQFGDTFAVLVSSVVCALSFYDISYMGYSLCCSVVLGIFTISGGSLRMSIVMHLIASSINYILALTGFLDAGTGRLLTILVYVVICVCELVIYFRYNYSSPWSNGEMPYSSELSFEKKIESMLSSNTIALYFVLALVLILILELLL